MAEPFGTSEDSSGRSVWNDASRGILWVVAASERRNLTIFEVVLEQVATNLDVMRTILLLLSMICALPGVGQHWNTDPVRLEGDVVRAFEWVFEGRRYGIDLTLRATDYRYYRTLPKVHDYAAYAGEHTDHPYLIDVVRRLDQHIDRLGLAGIRLAGFLTAFVQQGIIYVPDPFFHGQDYPKYPIETLVDQEGDCEDSAALLAALFSAYGLDCILISPPQHMAVGLECTSCTEGVYEHKGKRYAYIETTNSHRIGHVPVEYRKREATFYSVPKMTLRDPGVASNPSTDRPAASGTRVVDAGPGDCVKTMTVSGVSYRIEGCDRVTLLMDGERVTFVDEEGVERNID